MTNFAMTVDQATTIHLLTLNCWGIPYISKDREARMNAIADQLASGNYDVVCLQEIWSINDFKLISEKTEKWLPYSHYFFSGVLGSGICIFSRYPIQDVMFHKWPLNGYVHKIRHGDWFGGKGVGLCKLLIDGMDVHIYVAHLHAEYDKENDEYMAHRVLQAFDTAQFIKITRGGAAAVVLAGDLNTEPQDLAYRIICGVAGLNDAYSSNPLLAKTHLGTNDCASNSYTSPAMAKLSPDGKRIDHILYLGSKHFQLKAFNFRHPLPSRVPKMDFSYSDHEGVMASFHLSKGEEESATMMDNDELQEQQQQPLKEAMDVCESAIKSLEQQKTWYLVASCLLVMPLVFSLGVDKSVVDSSTAFLVTYVLSRLFLAALLCYSLFMATIWNRLENNALKSCYLSMELHLKHRTYNNSHKPRVSPYQ